MTTKLVSYDSLAPLLGQWDRTEDRTNRRELMAMKAVLRAALERELTARQRECVQLYYYESLTEEETARKLGVSRSTVCRHLQKARNRLEGALRYAGAARGIFAGED